MEREVRSVALALALAAAPVLAHAQSPSPPAGTTTPPAISNAQAQISLTPEQKSAIRAAIQQKGTSVTPSLTFRPVVGELVPPSIELYPLPDNAMAEAPDAKNLKYTMLEDQVVLVDPLTMRIVDTIRR